MGEGSKPFKAENSEECYLGRVVQVNRAGFPGRHASSLGAHSRPKSKFDKMIQ